MPRPSGQGEGILVILLAEVFVLDGTLYGVELVQLLLRHKG